MALPASIRVVELCAGAGAMGLGIKRVLPQARTVVYVEIEAYAAATLVARMQEGRLDAAPLWSDLRTFDARPWRGRLDLVVGGYPCQPFSLAGARRGTDDPRHLWPHIARILRECEAPFAFFENVPGHVSLGLRDVRCDLEEMGYRTEAVLVRAEEVGAPHRRERLFLLAYAASLEHLRGALPAREWSSVAGAGDGSGAMANASRGEVDGYEPGAHGGAGERGLAAASGEAMADSDSKPLRQQSRRRSGTLGPGTGLAGNDGAEMGDADRSRLEGWGMRGLSGADECAAWPPGPADADGWAEYLALFPDAQPALCRGDARLANRLDRLRLLGNLNPPQQYELALRLLLERIGK